MNDKLSAGKAAMTAVITAIGSFLGWKGIMAVVWVAAMALDYASGTAAACKEGNWSSEAARSGLWHKSGMIIVVTASAIADGIMSVICQNLPLGIKWPCIILPLVITWYIITEMGSILENAVKMGTAVPGWLTKLLKVSLKAVDSAGDEIMSSDANDPKS